MKKIKKKFLIIGGAGFIGRNLIKKINSTKNEVHILDLKKQNLKYFKKNKSYKIFNGDISKKKTFKLINHKYDKVFFLAAETSTFICEKKPLKCLKTNILGVINFYYWCIEKKPKEVIFTSSMAVYGFKAINVNENTLEKPISVYGVSKLIGEQILSKLFFTKIKIRIFRLFNVYGPGQDYENLDQGMLSIYLIQAIKKKCVKVKGSLNRFRDFIYVDDVCNCLLSNFKVNENFTYNLGTGKKTYVKNLIRLIFKNLKIKYNVISLNSHSGDTFGSYSNINKIKKKGIKIKYNLQDGLKKTIKELKKYERYSSYFNR